jgi:alpha-aminoadipate/glutamate carrier protein LysW
MVTCPVCDAEIDIEEEEVDEGESVGCDECGADLKVLGKTPLELTPSDQVEVDEDELFDDDDEDLEEIEEEEEGEDI